MGADQGPNGEGESGAGAGSGGSAHPGQCIGSGDGAGSRTEPLAAHPGIVGGKGGGSLLLCTSSPLSVLGLGLSTRGHTPLAHPAAVGAVSRSPKAKAAKQRAPSLQWAPASTLTPLGSALAVAGEGEQGGEAVMCHPTPSLAGSFQPTPWGEEAHPALGCDSNRRGRGPSPC